MYVGVGDLLGNTQLYQHCQKSARPSSTYIPYMSEKEGYHSLLMLALLLTDHILIWERVVSLPRVSYSTVVLAQSYLREKSTAVNLP